MNDQAGIIVLYSLLTGFFAGISVCWLVFGTYRWFHGRRAKKMAQVVSIKEYLN